MMERPEKPSLCFIDSEGHRQVGNAVRDDMDLARIDIIIASQQARAFCRHHNNARRGPADARRSSQCLLKIGGEGGCIGSSWGSTQPIYQPLRRFVST
jgi:hypothetical protein